MTYTNHLNINNVFKIPICYNNKVQKLNENIINELELVKNIDTGTDTHKDTDETPIYDCIFKSNDKSSNMIVKQISEYYTTDVDFLTETQELTKLIELQDTNYINNKHTFTDYDLHDVIDIWEDIKNDNGFYDKYLYVSFNYFKKYNVSSYLDNLNNNPLFLQIMCLFHITSPLLSLCLPIIILILPFILIKMRGIELNVSQYIHVLTKIISNHAMFKIFTQFHQVDNNQKCMLILSCFFYLLSIYQNIMLCIKFYSNMQKIHNYVNKFKKYIEYTLETMDYYQYKCDKLTTYNDFKLELQKHKQVLLVLHSDMSKITPFSFSFSKVTELGNIMCWFYKLYNNIDYNDAFLYSFGFNCYFNILKHIKTNISENKLTPTTYCNKTKPIFSQMYYPKFINHKSNDIVKNNCNLTKNMIITGPNASGKTTTLKSSFINILLSQQIGFGCFNSLKLTPFDKFHCYLNIPDTSGRDSLFQAEARRCKHIIDIINDNTHDVKHFCIFDELYSGTNPEEAIISANAFMQYIVKFKNVSCMLTTHYNKLCKKLSKNKMIINYNMQK